MNNSKLRASLLNQKGCSLFKRKEISMNRKKLWLTAFVLALGGTVSFAQEQKIKEEGKIEFRPHLVYASAGRCCPYSWRS